MKRYRLPLIAVVALLALAAVGPLMVPIPPLPDTVPPEQLADPDSRFRRINGVNLHYKIMGQGEPTYILLHGFAASLFSWREVMAPLAQRGTVVAFDRPAFGLTERPLPEDWNGPNPYSAEAQVEIIVALMDTLSIRRAILIGNSAGGTIATLAALRHPDRVQALVLVDAAIYTGGRSAAWLAPLLETPQAARLGPLFVRSTPRWGRDFGRSAWHDPSKLSDEIWAGYTLPLRAQNWDRGLWEFQRASRSLGLDQRLAEIQAPTLVITGDDDRIVPAEQSLRLAHEVPDARLVVIPHCGHLPQEERPQEFLAAVNEFVAGLA